jgi:hypothetical protein
MPGYSISKRYPNVIRQHDVGQEGRSERQTVNLVAQTSRNKKENEVGKKKLLNRRATHHSPFVDVRSGGNIIIIFLRDLYLLSLGFKPRRREAATFQALCIRACNLLSIMPYGTPERSHSPKLRRRRRQFLKLLCCFVSARYKDFYFCL